MASTSGGPQAPKIGAALVGCGYWGAKLCRILATHAGIQLRWVCDRSDSARAQASSLAPGTRATASVNSIMSDPATEVVVVATPAASHHRLAMAALRAGKHVFVEKPLAMSAADARQLCEEAESRRLVLMVGHTFLYNTAVRQVKAIIDAGELGDLHYVLTRRLNLGIIRQDVDALWNLAPHDVSMLNYWIDRPIEWVSAVGHAFLQPGTADVVFAHLAYAGNVTGHLHVSWLDPAKVRSAVVVGSRRMLTFDDTSPDAPIVVHDKRAVVTSTAGTEKTISVVNGTASPRAIEVPAPLKTEIDDLHRCVMEGSPPLADGRNGLAVVEILERLSDSMRLHSQRGGVGVAEQPFPGLIEIRASR
jgi:predicted dehydrogenase